VVEDGQHLSAIAERYHFGNMETLWNAPENAGLRAVREDPHQLLPGDQVVIPKVRKARFVRPSGQMHEFVVHVEKLKLRLKVLDFLGEPISNEEGTILVEGQEIAARTDGDGMLEVRIPGNAAKATLSLGPHEFELKIGGMAPVSESSGVQARLNNLGFWAGASDPDDDATPPQADLPTAIDQFRSLHDVGEAAGDLAVRLVEEYGS
jgi:hypothetical protein